MGRSYQEPCMSSTVQHTQEYSASSNGIFPSKDFLNLNTLLNLQKTISDMRHRIKRLNGTIDSLRESEGNEEDCATSNDSLTSTHSANDSDVHMKTLTDITDVEADYFNGHTEPNANNNVLQQIIFPSIQTIQPVNSNISNFDNSPLSFANAQANINLVHDQNTVTNTDSATQELNNNNPNMISYNVIGANLTSDLTEIIGQVNQYNFSGSTDSVQTNNNPNFYAQNYVNTTGNNNTLCSVIPCNIPPICAPRVNTSYISAVENCIHQLENSLPQGLQSMPTGASNNKSTNYSQQFNTQNIFDGSNSSSTGTVIGVQLNGIQETLHNNICDAISNQQSNDNLRKMQTETGIQEEVVTTIAPTSNAITYLTDSSNSAFTLVPNNSYKQISRRISSDSNELIINEVPINSTETLPEDTTETQDLIKIWEDFSPRKKAVIQKNATTKSHNETLSSTNTALNYRNNTHFQKKLQSQSNLDTHSDLESQPNVESQSYLEFQSYLTSEPDLKLPSNLATQTHLKTQSSLESQTTEPTPEIKIKKSPDSLLLEALKVNETTNTDGNVCQKSNTTPRRRRHSKDIGRKFKDLKEPLTDCNSKKNSTNKESKPCAVVVNSPVKIKNSNENEKKSTKHRTKSRSSKRKKTDDDQNGIEKPDNTKKMDVRQKEIYERQNSYSYYNLKSAPNDVGPGYYYRYINDYDWPYDRESYYYNRRDDVRTNLDITYSQVSHNYRIPDWPYDTTTNFRRNEKNKEVPEKKRSKKSSRSEQKESKTKQPSSSKNADKPNVTDILSNKDSKFSNKSSSKPANQPKKHLEQTSKSRTPPKKTSQQNSQSNVTKTENVIEKTQTKDQGKKSPVYVFREGTFCGVYLTDNPGSPDPEATEMVEKQHALKSFDNLESTSGVPSANTAEKTTSKKSVNNSRKNATVSKSANNSENNTSNSKTVSQSKTEVRELQKTSHSIRRTSDKFDLEKFADNLKKLVNPNKENRADI